MFGRNDLTVCRAIRSKILQCTDPSRRELMENYSLDDLTTGNQFRRQILGVRPNCTAKL